MKKKKKKKTVNQHKTRNLTWFDKFYTYFYVQQ